ncbi:hypothetical protein G6N82_14280 [Altererythrobacter sp. BO-6]|uniref:hypothetical protein n=1 Tax=Altererythrobacter sp. BO-6 TaxID=2604537 RepID=UPI0013E19830|nr:hypothetical protein [Altererythrobacter sp. BO-6]QIG55158.1 hypothetical protein G6N82_14280 [Altererythrobacter sp. BO-6]
MSDAQAIPTKTKSEAADVIALFKQNGYSNIALIGPVTSVQTVEVGGANWLVVGTNAEMTILPTR